MVIGTGRLWPALNPRTIRCFLILEIEISQDQHGHQPFHVFKILGLYPLYPPSANVTWLDNQHLRIPGKVTPTRSSHTACPGTGTAQLSTWSQFLPSGIGLRGSFHAGLLTCAGPQNAEEGASFQLQASLLGGRHPTSRLACWWMSDFAVHSSTSSCPN